MNATLTEKPATTLESDRRIREAVLRQIEWEPEIFSRDIVVGVEEGVVTLTGYVHNYFEKAAAERAAKAVYAVKAVANDIEVKPSSAHTDPEIARDVVHAMKLHGMVPDDRIKTSVRDGFVTLDGSVEWNFQRANAEWCARGVTGVRGVSNLIKVTPKVSPFQVKEKIEEALRRSAEVDARRISVTSHEGTVELYGHVRSWMEREEATRAAWAAPGVTNVIDHLVVVP
jgi:osmotically-inducible protein OsmY